MKKTVLVTGGCGYIGSHICKLLSKQGYQVIVYDNLTTGSADSLLGNETLIVGDLMDSFKLSSVFSKYNIDIIIHLAASIVVKESTEDPLKYYHNNTSGTVNLLKLAVDHHVSKVVFSSTAAVYGNVENGIAQEDDATHPESPYGRSKLFDEHIIQDLAKATGLEYVILRYFNVAGADLTGQIGQKVLNATHLIKVCCETALGLRDQVNIFGTDFNSKDGTGVRDYIHVEDLAEAHYCALNHLLSGGASYILNCGYGVGYSVKEVVKTFNDVLSMPLNFSYANRRAGDVGTVISDSRKIRKLLSWKPRFDSLELIVLSSLLWESKFRNLPIKLKQDSQKSIQRYAAQMSTIGA